MRSYLLLRAATVMTAAVMTLSALAQSSLSLLQTSKPIVDKNFYLLSALERDAAVRRILTEDSEIARIQAARRALIAPPSESCSPIVACQLRSLEWTDEEILAVSLALRKLGNQNTEVKALVEHELRPSHAYILLEKLDDGELLAGAWEISVRGINHIIEIYGLAAQPRYPLIDSISIDTGSADGTLRIAALAKEEAAPDAASRMFYASSLHTALTLLEMNHRDEAGRHEPMEDGINKAALATIATTHWKNYRFATIVVPGIGPTDRETPLSETGHKLVALAAEAYRAGKAPFILVTGGYVHPAQTCFAEAIEMKRALMDEFHIPESAIIADPHARHTTTNLRNASRLIFRYGIPMDMPSLIVTFPDETKIYISGKEFEERCVRELGYVPYRLIPYNAETEIAFLPQLESLEEDPIDPLDP